MNSATFRWPRSPPSCCSRSSQREPRRPPSSSPPTCPSPSGHRSSPTHGSARLCSIGSPIRRTSSRQARSRTASGEPCGRRQKTKPGCSVLLPLRPSGYAPAEPSTPTATSHRVGQNKPPHVGQAKLPNSTEEPDFDLSDENGNVVAWPVRSDGALGRWGVGPTTLINLIESGYAAAGRFDRKRKTWGITYLSEQVREELD